MAISPTANCQRQLMKRVCKHKATQNQAIQQHTQDTGQIQCPPETRDTAAIVESMDTQCSTAGPNLNLKEISNCHLIRKKLGQPHLQPPFLTVVMPPFSSNLFFVTLTFKSLSLKFLVDSGAFSSALTPSMLEKIKSSAPQSIKYLETNPFPVVKVANATHAKTLGKVEITFTLANQVFTEKFLLLPRMNNPILGLPFYKNNRILINVASQKLHLPEISLQISEMTMRNGKTKTKFKKQIRSQNNPKIGHFPQ